MLSRREVLKMAAVYRDMARRVVDRRLQSKLLARAEQYKVVARALQDEIVPGEEEARRPHDRRTP
jgi:hypothetical protein